MKTYTGTLPSPLRGLNDPRSTGGPQPLKRVDTVAQRGTKTS